MPERDIIAMLRDDPLLPRLTLANLRAWLEREYSIVIDTAAALRIPPYEGES
jgi:hypothetical protein